MGIHATDDLSALAGSGIEPYRSGHYDFDEFEVVYLKYGTKQNRGGDLEDLFVCDRTSFHQDWNEARAQFTKAQSQGQICKLLGRVFN